MPRIALHACVADSTLLHVGENVAISIYRIIPVRIKIREVDRTIIEDSPFLIATSYMNFIDKNLGTLNKIE